MRTELVKLLEKNQIHDGIIREFLSKSDQTDGIRTQTIRFIDDAIADRLKQIEILKEIKENLLAKNQSTE